ncbi:DUF928 domain-containing protein [Argonema antarcticum]|uniref:DUF928 domain-containing protein n=1 Tax=Argonema antarcticum TaxID=2942763 RepID=UPI0020117365|nr:DUF928 domain-containing protein [Argonema antarcticum]MCL1473061.1 DUF928 domain-containing protein [Argonema antarcticum A004/B2]
MALLKQVVSIATSSAVISLEILLTPGCSTQKQEQYEKSSLHQKSASVSVVAQTFQAPNRGAPTATVGSASRSGSCVLSRQKNLTVLLPQSNLGLTVSQRPTFFAYVPKSTAQKGLFVLKDRNHREVYRKNFTLPNQPGIVSISLPATAPPLEVGKMYEWNLLIVCSPDSNDQSGNAIAGGWIERIQPSQALVNQLKNAPPITVPALYAKAGIWHEAFGNLVKLRRNQPNDATLLANWGEMLKSVGLENFIQEPLVDCC